MNEFQCCKECRTGQDCGLTRRCAKLRAAPPAPVSRAEWLPIETAPKDGTAIDLWVDGEFSHRRPGCFWGLPHHCCGEMGSYCDSEWHGLEPGWVDDFNQPLSELDRKPTHWMSLPVAPGATSAPLTNEGGSEGVNPDLSKIAGTSQYAARFAAPAPSASPAAAPQPSANAQQAVQLEGWAFFCRDDGIWRVTPPIGETWVTHPGAPAHALITALMSRKAKGPPMAAVALTDERAAMELALSSMLAMGCSEAHPAIISLRRALLAADPPSEDMLERLRNPMPPFGMLVRTLRIVSGSLLMDMAKDLQLAPSELSAYECGRKPIPEELPRHAANYFERQGVGGTLSALSRARRVSIDAAIAKGEGK